MASSSSTHAPSSSTGRQSTEQRSPLRILICSANLGNAEPTPESIAAWIPSDGAFSEVVTKTEFPVPKVNGTTTSTAAAVAAAVGAATTLPENHDDKANSCNHRRDDYFDIIVVGMQEATFESKSSVNDNTNNNDTSSNSGSNNDDKSPKKGIIDNDDNDSSTSKFSSSDPSSSSSSSSFNLQTNLENNIKKVAAIPMKVAHVVNTMVAHGDLGEPATKIELPMGTTLTLQKPEHFLGGTKELYDLISKRCPSYDFVVRHQRGEMRLDILVRKDLVEEVVKVGCFAENTGIGHVMANKGGIIATIIIGKTRLSFLTAHLEAHEGDSHYKARCSNIAEILDGARPMMTLHDASITSHHLFVCGDLNFRVHVPGMVDDDDDGEDEQITKEDKERKVQSVIKLVEWKNWMELNAVDELQKALDQGVCLVGFQTLPCYFPPTFKVERTKGFVYKTNRTPSYTDRILWKSAHGLTDKVKPILYEPIPSFDTSDHKPIRGAFTLIPNASKSVGVASSNEKDENKNLHMIISEIKCTDLPGVKNGRRTDPYIVFITDPKELIKQGNTFITNMLSKVGIGMSKSEETSEEESTHERTRKGWPCTKVKYGTKAPDWGEDELHLIIQTPKDDADKMDDSEGNTTWGDDTMQLTIRKPKKTLDLTGAMLYLTVMDYGSPAPPPNPPTDYVIGSVSLNISHLCDSEVHCDGGEHEGMTFISIDEPLLKSGKMQGRLTCKVFNCWISDSEKDSLKSRYAMMKTQSM